VKDPRDVILSPVVSEKSYASLDNGVYTFVVSPDANKTEIRDAIQRIFDVKVVQVNTMWRKGKRKRTRYTMGQRAAQKRAVVTLAEGDSIEIFNPSR
jgi:large subunit ribosomal protein L23